MWFWKLEIYYLKIYIFMTDSVSLSEGLCQQMIHENFSQWLASTRAIRMCKTEYSFDPSTDPPRCKTENQLVFKKNNVKRQVT